MSPAEKQNVAKKKIVEETRSRTGEVCHVAMACKSQTGCLHLLNSTLSHVHGPFVSNFIKSVLIVTTHSFSFLHSLCHRVPSSLSKKNSFADGLTRPCSAIACRSRTSWSGHDEDVLSTIVSTTAWSTPMSTIVSTPICPHSLHELSIIDGPLIML
jgi:hypothetical protein